MFKQNLAIVIALASKALDRRHWEALSDVVASKTEAEGIEKVSECVSDWVNGMHRRMW